MFVFALFVMPPFYNLFCSVLDINSPRLNSAVHSRRGKVDKSGPAGEGAVCQSINNAGNAWEFYRGGVG